MKKNQSIFLLLIACCFFLVASNSLKFGNETLLNGKGILGIPISITEYENSELKEVYSTIKIDLPKDLVVEQINKLNKRVENESDFTRSWKTSYGTISVIFDDNRVVFKEVTLNNQIRSEITETLLDGIRVDMPLTDVLKVLNTPLECTEYIDTDKKIVRQYKWISMNKFTEYNDISNWYPKGHVVIVSIKAGKVMSLSKY